MDLSKLGLEFIVILILIGLNGLLSMSEMAMVSARKIRLQQEADKGQSGAQTALRLLEEPSRFLAAIQVGITLIGVLAGAFGGASIARELTPFFAQFPFLAPYATSVSLGSVVLVITLLSLVFGELIPKRLALGRAEGITMMIAKPINFLVVLSRPAVHFLSFATEGFLKLLRYQQPEDAAVSDYEVNILMEQGALAGVFEREEEAIIKRTLRLSDRTIEEVMTKRIQLVCIDIDDPLEKNLEYIKSSNHTYFPVFQESIDKIIGVISTKQLLSAAIDGPISDLRPFLQEPLFVPSVMPALRLLEIFQTSGKHFAIVIDEYGGLSGVVTVLDFLEALVGDLPEEMAEGISEVAVLRDDGSWLIDGIMQLEDICTALSLPEDEFFPDDYSTLGGFLMNELGYIPRAGDKLFWKSWWFEVVDMDGNRVDKVLAYPAKA
ncbi:MAG: hemolysin family protein [Oligoflexus sp.]